MSAAQIEWQHEQGTWISYDPYIEKSIYEHIKRHQSTQFSNIPPYSFFIGSQTYIIDFDKQHQMNTQTGTSRKIRMDVILPPILSSNIILPIAYHTLPSDEQCPLCLEKFLPTDQIVILKSCHGHYFHKYCNGISSSIEKHIEKTLQCPVCKNRYGIVSGNMPSTGRMDVAKRNYSLPGFDGYKTIEIYFFFPSGVQDDSHPNPGQHYSSDERYAYLPDCKEGQKVLELFKKAWDYRLLFTIGKSITRSLDGCIIYNGIHMKTVAVSTPRNPHGYPDNTYLTRVMQELESKGIS